MAKIRKRHKRAYRKKDTSKNPRFQMEGKEIGNIKVTSFSHTINRRSHWNCICFCGKTVVISRRNMCGRASKNISCGCVAKKSPGHLNERTEQEKKDHKLNCLINLSHPEGNCRIWDGYCRPSDTPRVSYLGISMATRRLVWVLSNGEVPKGFQVTNTCGNIKCIELKHLFLELKGNNRWKNK